MSDGFFRTVHRFFSSDARDLGILDDRSVDLVVTSPPYPMIAMWDGLFGTLSPGAGRALREKEGWRAFELMHLELDKVWHELYRVLKEGAFACINVGDATRTVENDFSLYPNHARIIQSCRKAGFNTLPLILWRKQTNAPNKFMGSGMLPAGAYPTLEHEYILVLRKGGKRNFTTDAQKMRRRESAFFWEERNSWFSDVWDFKGIKQRLRSSALRDRSGAFPFELAYRLICMYSLYGDTVIDPFAGTGTTMLAAAVCGRNSTGIELDTAFHRIFSGEMNTTCPLAENIITERLCRHTSFVADRTAKRGPPKYVNSRHGFTVMTRQETELLLRKAEKVVEAEKELFTVEYRTLERCNDEGAV